jgi:predicted transcriptional regulator
MPAKTKARKVTPHPVNVRLPAEVGAQLERFAKMSKRSKSSVIVHAIEDFLAWRVPQQADLERALAEAKRGKLIENAEVIAWLEGFIAEHAR